MNVRLTLHSAEPIRDALARGKYRSLEERVERFGVPERSQEDPRVASPEGTHDMPDDIARVRITEDELARDTHAVLAKVQEGVEVIVKQDHRPLAVIRRPHRSGRPISEILRQAKERNSTVTLDSDFSRDLQTIIASHQQARNPPSWE
jgi:antitoxin (DNA-binding transcriptional repressor) of toxin-antitoxin stability system